MNQMPMAMYGVLFWWYSMPMAMMLMPFPCPVVTVTDTHGTDTMNQIPMAMMPISMQSIPMPCVASSGGDRHL